MKMFISFCGIAVTLMAMTFFIAGNRIAHLKKQHPALGAFVTIEGRKLHFFEMGQGVPIVLLHGASGNMRDLLPLGKELSSQHRVILVDRPGLGYSDPLPKGQHHLRDQAHILHLAMAHLGVKRPVIVGHSFGGAVALAWALEQQSSVRALVTIAGPSHPWEGTSPLLYRIVNIPGLGKLIAWTLAAYTPDAIISKMTQEVFLPQNMTDAYIHDAAIALVLTPQAMRANAAQRVDLLADIVELSPHYPSLSMPIEIVHGTKDDVVALDIHAKKMIAATDMAQLTRLPGIGHMPHHLAERTEVIAAISRAIDRSGI